MRYIFRYLYIVLITLVYGGNFYPTLPLNIDSNNRNTIDHLIGIMVEFPEEITDNPNTSGNGKILLNSLDLMPEVLERCDGFIADSPPHNVKYFSDQMLAVSNYFENVSNGHQIFTYTIIDSVYELPSLMSEYGQTEIELTQAFIDAVDIAADSVGNYFTSNSIVVAFHAGVGQDFAVPFIDPTPYDLSSAYIDEEMLSTIEIPENIESFLSNGGILLPETQNHIYYNVIEDIFYDESDFCDYQIGITGTFALLLGYAIGLPPLYNTDTGDAGVGVFGLMDHGSNNGRGVIPAPPTAWTRLLMGWDEEIILTENDDYDSIITSSIYKVQISENEYFLIENRNNWIQFNADLDSLRFKNKIDNNTLGRWFDTLLDETILTQITIDPESGVILGVDNYNYGLPGSGLLIWHITEPSPLDFPIGINNDPNYRAIHLEEADGAVDIGFPNAALFADPTKGWRWDMWYMDNPAYDEQNPFLNGIRFDNFTRPNTRTQSGSESFIAFTNISEPNYVMDFTLSLTDNIETVLLYNDSITVIGNSVLNDTGYVYYTFGNQLFKRNNIYLDSIEISLDFNQILLSNDICDTLISPEQTGLTYLNDNCEIINDDNIYPAGYTNSLENITEEPLALSLGDIDLDGFDEIIYIDVNDDLIVINGNDTWSNGFPLMGDFYGYPLVANIDNDAYPEIICRENNNIVIISHLGERKRIFSSMDLDQSLSLIPHWRLDTIGLVDGNRILLFPQDLEHSYWLNPNSQPSNQPIVTGPIIRVGKDSFAGIDKNRTYNYPNPILKSETTFRYFVGEANKVDITIFTVSGFPVDHLTNDDLTNNEFNETKWDASNVNSGLYFAEVKPDNGDVAMVRVVVIR